MKGEASIYSPPVVCPACGRTESVEKVSTLYLAGIGIRRSATLTQAGESLSSQVLDHLPALSAQELKALSRQLTPPSSGTALPTRPVHPDLVVLVFSGVIPIFLAGIVNQQPGALIPILFFLALCYSLYFYKRKAIIARFTNSQTEQKSKQKRIELGIQKWMKLYYCCEDKGVFLPGRNDLVPIEEVLDYITEES